jgi:hypothetical protein
MEEKCSSETSLDFQWIALRYILKERNLYEHPCVDVLHYKLIIKGNPKSILTVAEMLKC